MKQHDVKIIQSGNVIEVIQFARPIYSGMDNKPPPTGRIRDACEEDKSKNRQVTVSRAKSDIRRLVGANSGQWKDETGKPYKPVFMTLTFAENVQDFDTANHEFKLFMLRLGNRVGDRKKQNCLKYVVVPEFQKRGAIHYHLILFNLPYIPQRELKDIWRNGSLHVKAIDSVDNVGAYISKYLRKDLGDERLKGKKCYFTSRGLLQPVKMELNTTDRQQGKMLESVVETAQALAVREYSVVYSSDYFEAITYTQYTLKES